MPENKVNFQLDKQQAILTLMAYEALMMMLIVNKTPLFAKNWRDELKYVKEMKDRLELQTKW